MGSGVVAAWVAHVSFWAILCLGTISGEIRRTAAAVFLGLWAIGYFVLPRISPFSGLLVTPYLAILDIVLVFFVFKGDVRLS